jgi:hypothetical protein
MKQKGNIMKYKVVASKKAKKGNPEMNHIFYIEEDNKPELIARIQSRVRQTFGEGFNIKITEMKEEK